MKKERISNIINNAFIYITILLFNFFSITKIIDSDFFFDIRSAKDILTYGLDFQDHMSMHEGLKYFYHHWLYDLIIYPIFNLGSYSLVFIFILILFFILSIVVYKYIYIHTNNKLISLVFTIILSFFIGEYYYPRVQSLSYLVILLEFIVIEKLYSTGKLRYSIISILLSIFMVNIHFPIWILIPVFYLPYLANMLVIFIKNKFKLKIFENKIEYIKCNNNKVFIFTFIGILISVLISPYGLLPYTFGLDVSRGYDYVYSNIGEMQKVSFAKSYGVLLFFAIIFILTLLSKNKIKLSSLFYLIGLGIFGTMYIRNLPFLYIYYILITTGIIFKDIKIKNIKINKNIICGILLIFEVFLLVESLIAIDIKNYDYGISQGGEPILSADYIINNIEDYQNKKIYNRFNVGSYLTYRGIPTFVDSRVEVFVEKFNGKDSIMYDYFNKTPEELIDKYKFDYFLVIKTDRMYDYLVKNDYEVINVSYNFYYLFKNKEA